MICTGCVLIDIILQKDTFEGDNERKANIAGLSSSLSRFNEMEKAGDNPQVSFQPVCVNIVTMDLVKRFVQLLRLHILAKVKITWLITDVLERVIALTTVRIKYVALTGFYIIKTVNSIII